MVFHAPRFQYCLAGAEALGKASSGNKMLHTQICPNGRGSSRQQKGVGSLIHAPRDPPPASKADQFQPQNHLGWVSELRKLFFLIFLMP